MARLNLSVKITRPAGAGSVRFDKAWREQSEPATPLAAGLSLSADVLDVSAQDLSSGDVQDRDLDWGDGSAHATGAGPWNHTYAAAGTYTLIYTVTDPDGRAAAVVEQITVGSYAASFTATPDAGDYHLIQFADTSTDDFGAIVSWHWLFGDGYESTLQNPHHTYDADGDYDAQLTTTDDRGQQATVTTSVGVHSPVATDGPDGWYWPTSPADYAALGTQTPEGLWLGADVADASGAPATIGATGLLIDDTDSALVYQDSLAAWTNPVLHHATDNTRGAVSNASVLDFSAQQTWAIATLVSIDDLASAVANSEISGVRGNQFCGVLGGTDLQRFQRSGENLVGGTSLRGLTLWMLMRHVAPADDPLGVGIWDLWTTIELITGTYLALTGGTFMACGLSGGSNRAWSWHRTEYTTDPAADMIADPRAWFTKMGVTLPY